MRLHLHRQTHCVPPPLAPRGRHLASLPAIDLGRPPEALVREAGGPEDRARYACGCGFAFRAAVSTSVTCPHCGSGQAW